MKSLKLNGTPPGVRGACGDDLRSAGKYDPGQWFEAGGGVGGGHDGSELCLVDGEGSGGKSCESVRAVALEDGSLESTLASNIRLGLPLGFIGPPRFPPPSSPPMLDILEVKLSPPLSRALTAPCPVSAPGNKTRPLARRPGPPPRALYATISCESLSLLVVGRAGEGDVARNNIRSAASLSVGAWG
jgi:hypothetical protein